ncbi:hypothetical protein LF817_16025 [Halobacillus sp. A1]|uniref:hypothetical protein n=1 Tax=Halobacillus sp. A1 TaxID=2880262 RepID=UPI0020A673E3|nr:hypothetical protein [Halobacillus sp. A1]MCP3032834.1 hypothetical protein [Halobacillus sp. A1]
MKKYLIFIVSFILLYLVYQMASGMLLTMNYTPDLSSVGGITPQEVSFGNRSFPLVVLICIASFAYIISQLLKPKKNETL